MSLSLLPKDKKEVSRSGNSEIDLGSFTLIIYALFSLKIKKEKKKTSRNSFVSNSHFPSLMNKEGVCSSPHCRTEEKAQVRVLNLWSLS